MKSDKPDDVVDGLTWRDMPGNGGDLKRMNFALFKRGRITKAYVLASTKEKTARNAINGARAQRVKGRFATQHASLYS